MDDKWKVLRTLKRTAGREKERLLDDWRGIVIQNKVVCTKDPFGNRWPNFTACFGSTDESGSREGYGFADVFISSCRDRPEDNRSSRLNVVARGILGNHLNDLDFLCS
uniref:uncharacterized protein LOC117153533 n=1 Tax=Bombus vancouverensis nearcticus TaxID=2705178 RepID=UPI00143B1339|nr:uncharacterized protein LOC117153533 [Bombus vancouverensis nearcticus]